MANSDAKQPRSPSQIAASRANGQLSTGPKTSLGRAISSANATRTGLYGKSVVMPGEDRDQIREIVEGTMGSFRMTSFAGCQLAQAASDAFVRLSRADRLGDKLLNVLLEERVTACEANNALVHASMTRDSLEGVAQLAEERNGSASREQVASLLAPLRRLAQAVIELDLPPRVGFPFAAATGAIDSDDLGDVPAEVFAALGEASRGVIAAIDERLPSLRLDVEKEREHQTQMLALVDDSRLRQLDKLRARLLKELDGLFRAMKHLKELEATGAAGAESPSPVVVEFRTVGRS